MTTPEAAKRRGVLRFLPAVTLVAVLTITASAEFELARTVLDLPPYIAWALPVAVDSYVLAALRSGRDVVPALAVMAGALAASMGAHLAAAESDPEEALPGYVVAPAATGIMIVLVVVAWRVHVLIEHLTHAEPVAGTSAPARLVPVHPPIELPESAPRAVRATPSAPQPDPAPARTDAEILADIHGQPPSIRTLKRTYAIGQNRATRIYRTATEAATQQSKTRTTSRTKNSDQERDSAQQHTTERNELEKAIQETARKDHEQTHPCITDRVGEPSPPGDDAAGAAESLFEAAELVVER